MAVAQVGQTDRLADEGPEGGDVPPVGADGVRALAVQPQADELLFGGVGRDRSRRDGVLTMSNDYQRLLASFEVALALARPSEFVERTLAQKILNLSAETIGEISALLTQAALDAIERGTEQITNGSLDACSYVSPRDRRRAALV